MVYLYQKVEQWSRLKAKPGGSTLIWSPAEGHLCQIWIKGKLLYNCCAIIAQGNFVICHHYIIYDFVNVGLC